MTFWHLPHFTLLLATMPGLIAAPASAAAPGSLQDFSLPQGTASPTPEVQGPVAPDLPQSQVPARPQPAPPSPTPSPSPTVRRPAVPIVLPRAPASATPTASPRPQRTAAPSPSPAPAPTPTAEALPGDSASPTPSVAPDVPPAPLPAPVTPLPAPALSAANEETEGPSLPLYAILGALAVALGGLAFWRWRSRPGTPARSTVPMVERPRLSMKPEAEEERPVLPLAPAPPPAPVSVVEPEGPISSDLTPVRLSMTLVNAALSWRLVLTNDGTEPLERLAVELDMISAHKDLSPAEGFGGPAPGAGRQEVGTLQPGETRVLQGDLRLPFPNIRPLWQGDVALMLPLVRWRVQAAGVEPVTRALLVGQPSPRNAATLQPFRLDLGPRNYPELASRNLANRDIANRNLTGADIG